MIRRGILTIFCLATVAAIAHSQKPPVIDEENDGLPGIRAGATRAQIEAMIRAVGRDPISPELIDRVDALFRPRSLDNTSRLDAVRARLADRALVARVDELAVKLTGKPADTRTLIALSARLFDRDDEPEMHFTFRDLLARESGERKTIQGRVVDEITGKPISGVVVSSSGVLARPDAKGAYVLKAPRPAHGQVFPLYFESPGYALTRMHHVWNDLPRVETCDVGLPKAGPFSGRVVDPEGKPIVGVEVILWVNNTAICRDPVLAEQQRSSVTLMKVLTDASGAYAFRNLPPETAQGQVARRLTASHRKYQPRMKQYTDNELLGEGWEITLEPGCVVRGVVVDDAGKPVPNAVISAPSDALVFSEYTTLTDAEGKFLLEYLSEGTINVIVRPRDHVVESATVDAKRAEPLDLRIVVAPGVYLTGKVIGEDGKPANTAMVGWVEAIDDEDRPVKGAVAQNRFTRTGEDGGFRLGPVAKGRYQITALVDSPRTIDKQYVQTGGEPIVFELKPDRR